MRHHKPTAVSAAGTARSAETVPAVLPRVVVLWLPERARVEVLELPVESGIGTRFSHLGRCWVVTGERPRSHVLVAVAESLGAGRSGS